MVSTSSAASTAMAALAPGAWNACSRWCRPPTNRHSPTMPLQISMTAANTVSRARPAFSGPDDNITETISATSITVTAIASTSVPNGSPTLCATTSAWCTAANTAPASATATSAISQPWPGISQASASVAAAAAGAPTVQAGSLLEVRAIPVCPFLSLCRAGRHGRAMQARMIAWWYAAYATFMVAAAGVWQTRRL
ncbi:hypothetical protein D9M68_585870 [compost metagenome]